MVNIISLYYIHGCQKLRLTQLDELLTEQG
jgi:hypothetical protein